MLSTETKRSKVVIVFGTKPDFDETAFKYLVLYLNKIQSIYEFEFGDLEDQNEEQGTEYPFSLSIRHSDSELIAKLRATKTGKEIAAQEQHYLIAIVGFPLEEELFWDFDGNIALITNAGWQRQYAPPSMFDFLVQSIYAVLCMMHPKLQGKFDCHPETRGCPFDYAANKSEARVDIALGLICDECKQTMIAEIDKEYYEQASKIFSADWIGHADQLDSVAYDLKRFFRFDLDRDSGFNKTFWE